MDINRTTKALIILDGFGIQDTDSSAVKAANTPVWDRLLSENPNVRIQTSGMAVGLPEGQMGNSEVGHMNIGAGRVVYQNLTRITKEIADGEFFDNPVLTASIDKAVAAGKAVHVVGLLSPGGVHSHQDHIFALFDMAANRGAEKIYLHAILDGRDMPPRSAEASLQAAQDKFASLGKGAIISVVGRYFAMDRDSRWDRVKQAYDAMTLGRGMYSASSGVEALEAAYARDENDEFVQATVIVDAAGDPIGRVEDGDTLICANFRPDRSREITRAFVEGEASLQAAQDKFASLGKGAIISVVGRYFAMDRDSRWDRVKQAYDAMTLGRGMYTASSGVEALEAAYARDENDEFVQATVIVDAAGDAIGRVEDGDTLICANFRPDRSREITRAFVEGEAFTGFERQIWPQLADFVMMTEYASDIDARCAYSPDALRNDLGEYISGLGRTQLRISETEKYAHVTFFFNGGQESVYPGEERILVPSPDVATYDLKPEMSLPEVSEKLCEAIRSKKYDLIISNFANGDMVGHTGKFEAAVKACEAVDKALGEVLAAMEEVGGETLITADHGNVELMVDPTSGQPHTSHTTWPVALIYDGPRKAHLKLEDGALCDLAPTLLRLMDLPQPKEMTGRVLANI